MAKADVGMSPISSCPYVLSLVIPQLSLGTFVLLWNMLFAILQIPVEGKNYKLYLLTQIPLAFLLGGFTDLVKWLLNPINFDGYWFKAVCVVVGTAITALGVYMTVKADLIMNGPEAFLHSLSNRTGVKFGSLKTGFDLSNLVLAIILSLVLLGRVAGIREGTIFAAIFTGIFVNMYSKIFGKKG